jgi:predicted RNA methylase
VRTYNNKLLQERARVALLREAIERIVKARAECPAMDLGALDIAIEQALIDAGWVESERE